MYLSSRSWKTFCLIKLTVIAKSTELFIFTIISHPNCMCKSFLVSSPFSSKKVFTLNTEKSSSSLSLFLFQAFINSRICWLSLQDFSSGCIYNSWYLHYLVQYLQMIVCYEIYNVCRKILSSSSLTADILRWKYVKVTTGKCVPAFFTGIFFSILARFFLHLIQYIQGLKSCQIGLHYIFNFCCLK